MELHYIGNELELFAEARHWKAYWSRMLDPWIGSRILDVGAGLGATARVLGGRRFERYVALEPDPGMCLRMIEDPVGMPADLEIVTGTVRDLPAADRFDTILYIDVLEHIEDDVAELERASEHLAPGGRIVVLAPAHPFLYSPFDAAVGHVRRYTRRSLARTRPDGLQEERIRYLDCVGLLASLANRLLLRAKLPTPKQIRLWDDVMVPSSARIDGLLAFSVGKTIIGSFRKPLS